MINLPEHLIDNKEVFFSYMKSKYPLVHKSNLFLRDLQFAIMGYFKMKGADVSRIKAEELAYGLAKKLEEANELILISDNTWKVNFSIDKPVVNIKEG